jgi:Ser/Thr protein kinase RdoA (MazF antagonist)
MPKGNLVGAGRTAEVFEWTDGWVLKLYRDWCPPEWARGEAQLSRALHAAGVPAPAVGELVELEGRLGFVCERVAGRSLLDRLTARPWLASRVGRELARLHRRIHEARVAVALPRIRDRIAGPVRESRELLGGDADRALARLDALPDGETVCHYDFHPGNVLGEGDALRIIDWATAGLGAPAADVARTLLILRSRYLPPGFPAALRPLAQGMKILLGSAYLAEYRKISGMTRPEIDAWLPPLAAARLWERVPGERQWLLHLVRSGLARGG